MEDETTETGLADGTDRGREIETEDQEVEVGNAIEDGGDEAHPCNQKKSSFTMKKNSRILQSKHWSQQKI